MEFVGSLKVTFLLEKQCKVRFNFGYGEKEGSDLRIWMPSFKRGDCRLSFATLYKSNGHLVSALFSFCGVVGLTGGRTSDSYGIMWILQD